MDGAEPQHPRSACLDRRSSLKRFSIVENAEELRPSRAQDSWVQSTWASARQARSSPGFNIAGLQP